MNDVVGLMSKHYLCTKIISTPVCRFTFGKEESPGNTGHHTS